MNLMKEKHSKTLSGFSSLKEPDLPIWQSPSFLFSLMGLINLASCLFFYFIGQRYIKSPTTVVLVTLGIAFFLFIIAYAVSRSLENLVELNKTKTEFIKIVSHQLRAPLTNIRWSIEFLISKRKDKGNEDGDKLEEEYLGMIKENSKRLENLLSDLLIVNRLKEDGFFENKEKLDFIPIIKEAIKDFQYFAKTSNVTLLTKMIDKPVYVYGNKLLLEMALENIVRNAIGFSKEGGIVGISLTYNPKYILIAVRDYGVGIPSKDKKYIFQRFFRGKAAFQNKPQGTGLSLYITKAIILKHNGKIWFKSKEGEGTTFFITLPIKN
jgi:signal transduction histidine kinase